jgi:hypothetical protein
MTPVHKGGHRPVAERTLAPCCERQFTAEPFVWAAASVLECNERADHVAPNRLAEHQLKGVPGTRRLYAPGD